MKNSLIKRMYVLLLLAILLTAGGIYLIMYFTMQNSIIEEARERSIGVKEYILSSLDGNDFEDIGEDTTAGIRASMRIQSVLDNLRGVGGISRLYIAALDENGAIITSQSATEDDVVYLPTGRLEADLRKSIREGVAVFGDSIYQTDEGGIFSIFWPVMDQDYNLLGVVCMEFNVDFLTDSSTRALNYGLILSGGLLLVISLISYLSMSRATEPYFKKLAYTDVLTGYENRMAFEHRLRECGALIDKGKQVTLIICDVNSLKYINDTYGHKLGDAYLKNTADILFDNLRGAGPLYRIGGDEFASIVVGRDDRYVGSLMISLRMESRMAVKGFPFSCACGSATFTPGLDGTLRDVFKRADDVMYEEKKRQKAAAK